jgi:hypothetical protein
MLAPVPQIPEFEIRLPTGPKAVSILSRDGERLAQALRNRSAGAGVATKIEQAMQLGESSTVVDVKVGEDEAVLEALADLRAEGDFSGRLEALESALREKIDAEQA